MEHKTDQSPQQARWRLLVGPAPISPCPRSPGVNHVTPQKEPGRPPALHLPRGTARLCSAAREVRSSKAWSRKTFSLGANTNAFVCAEAAYQTATEFSSTLLIIVGRVDATLQSRREVPDRPGLCSTPTNGSPDWNLAKPYRSDSLS